MYSEIVLPILLAVFSIIGVLIGYWFKGWQDRKEYDRRKKEEKFEESLEVKRQLLREIHPVIHQIYLKMGSFPDEAGKENQQTKQEMYELQKKVDEALPFFLNEPEVNKKLHHLRNLVFANPKDLRNSGAEDPWVTSENIEEIIEKRIQEIDEILGG